MTKEDLQQIRAIIQEELVPMKEDIATLKEDIDELKYNMKIVKNASNALCEWAEAASKYYTPKIHFPLKDDEKIS